MDEASLERLDGGGGLEELAAVIFSRGVLGRTEEEGGMGTKGSPGKFLKVSRFFSLDGVML